jgi:hypothetical protein
MFAAGLLFVISGSKIRYVMKLRKGIVYLFTNFRKKNIVKQKMYDFRTHVRHILREKRKHRK